MNTNSVLHTTFAQTQENRKEQLEPLINSIINPNQKIGSTILGDSEASSDPEVEPAIPLPQEESGTSNGKLMDDFVLRLRAENLLDDETIEFYNKNKNTLEAVEQVLARWAKADRDGVRSKDSPHLQMFRAPRDQFPNATQSPFRLDNLVLLLGDQQPKVVNYLTRSCKEGFKIEMNQPRPSVVYPNPPAESTEALEALAASVHTDFERGHIGKRTQAAVETFVSNPIRPEAKKKNGRKVPGKFRRVHNLSKQSSGSLSVNSAIAKEDCTLQYETVQNLVDDICELFSEGSDNVAINSDDLQNAYRVIPLHPSCWGQLGFSWDGVEYVELFLPFGVSSACRIFSCLSSTVRWLLKYTLHLRHVRSYIDDFANAAPAHRASISARIMHLTFDILGLPTAPEKRVIAASKTTFLGIGIDTKLRVLFMPPERQQNLLQDIEAWSQKDVATLCELQSLCGHLMHATRTVPQGRLFVRRLFAKTRWHEEHSHYHSAIKVKLDPEFRRDLDWWRSFLTVWNGKTKLRASSAAEPEAEIISRTDASDIAGGGVVGLTYFQTLWSGECAYMAKQRTNINERELFAVVTCALTHGPTWTRKRVIFLVDNHTDVDAMKKNNSKSRINLHLLRVLHFTAAICDFEWTVRHLPGVLNIHADAASRSSIQEFESRYPQFRRVAPTLPPHFDSEDWEAYASVSLLARLSESKTE